MKKGSKELRGGCISFTIDVSIQHSAIYYKRKWRHAAASYKRLLKKKIALEKAIQQTIASQIQRKISSYHVIAGLEIEIPSVPMFMWEKMMQHWVTYTPKRRKTHFIEYKKTLKGKEFFASFPKVQQDKIVAPGTTMRITVSQQAPARAIYDVQGERIVLTFWYEPFPFPKGWYPTYKHCKSHSQQVKPRKGYWMDK